MSKKNTHSIGPDESSKNVLSAIEDRLSQQTSPPQSRGQAIQYKADVLKENQDEADEIRASLAQVEELKKKGF